MVHGKSQAATKGRCYHCGREVMVRKDGKAAAHRLRDGRGARVNATRCRGGSQLPETPTEAARRLARGGE